MLRRVRAVGWIVGVAAVLAVGAAPARAENACAIPDDMNASASDLAARVAACTSAADADPHDARARLTLGRLQERRRDFAAAEAALSSAIAIDQTLAAAWAERCNARLMQQKLGDAADDCTRAIGLGSQDAGPYFARGQIRVLTSDFAGGRADLDRAIAKAPNHAPLLDYWRAKADYGLHLWPDTVTDITRYIAAVADDPDAYRLRAAALINQHQVPASLADLKRAKDLYFNRGDLQRANSMESLIQRFSAPPS
jgi:tetratricopeptide (TPR) repeat protein